MLQIEDMIQMGVWCNGNMIDSKPTDGGSIPPTSAKLWYSLMVERAPYKGLTLVQL